MPITVEEYQIGQLYAVAVASEENTGGGEGVEVRANEPMSDANKPNTPLLHPEIHTTGQFTHKIYHLQSKVPRIVKAIAPRGSLEFHELAWNAYPYCRTIVDNPGYMKENFFIKIETMHIADRGTTENAHELPPDLLRKREVIIVDITDRNQIKDADYNPKYDPERYHSFKTERGPLRRGVWMREANPVMCCYKLVTCEFKWFGLQTKVESFIQSLYPRLFNTFHRQVFCTLDKWHGMTMADIRAMEDETKRRLDDERKNAPARGYQVD